MTLSSVDLGISKDKPAESDNICCRVLSDYSREICELFTKEGKEKKNYKQTEGKPSGSLGSSEQCKILAHTSGRKPVSKKPSSFKNETKLLNVADSIALENKWCKKWANCLKAKENTTVQNQKGTNPQKEIEEITEGELDALRSFCTARINLMSKQRKKNRTKKLQHKPEGENHVSEKSDLSISVQQVNKLNLKDSKAPVRKIAEKKEPNSTHNSDHNKKKELKKVASMTNKKSFLELTRIQEKMEEYKYIKDTLILIAEIHKNLPRLSDEPDKVWKKLNIEGHIK
ncbi:uncharacterized protein C8orf48-like [Sarcophilus harrisii]|uniref:Uncharacterized protein n=1 Tax=Sarcophilus harrisii TaxID=9305 RepID=A0A7N4V3A4_SARHA|nr:uncharacterized protein C8orf48-like [Sarcophilus harrisii]